jgi:small subunit ribosomal protein S17
MSDDETKKDETPQEETPQDENPQDEAAEAAGPVSDETPSPEGDGPSSSPPAAEASQADAEEAPAAEAAEDEGPAEEAAAEASDDAQAEEAEAPAAEAEAAEAGPEDELPWKERRRLAKSRRQPRKAGPSGPEERKAARVVARKRKAELRRKQREAAKGARTAGTGTPPAERESNAAKVRQGIVVSSKGDKSITVRIDIARRHRAYEKIVRSSTKLHAHDERNEAGEGDVVRVIETRPLSKTKRWRLVDVVEKAR